MNNKKKIVAGALAAVMLIGASTFAYFTDRAESNFKAEAGNMCLTNVSEDADLVNMAPGDTREIKYVYENTGTVSMDTRITYIMHYDKDDSFKGKLNDIAKLTDGDNELTMNVENNNKMTVDGPTLKGAEETSGDALLDKTVQFELLDGVGNGAQNMSFKIDIIIEGKQTVNGAEWDELNTKIITVNGEELRVVEESPCNVIDYTPYFKYTENYSLVTVDGFVDNVEQLIDDLGEVDKSFRYNPIIPEEYNGKPVTEIGTDAFANKELETVAIPDSIKLIAHWAFRNNELRSIDLPDSIISIGWGSFQDNNLSSVSISNSMAKIPLNAFNNNELESIIIPNNIKELDDNSFRDNKITSVKLGDSLEKIGASVFRGNAIDSIELPNSLREVGSNTFNGNKIKSLAIPNSVKEIGYSAFRGNDISSLTISSSLKTIQSSVFQNNQLTEVTIPDSVTVIETLAFSGNQIATIDLHDSITTIEGHAFKDNKIRELILPKSLDSLNNYSFANNLLDTVVIPDSIKKVSRSPFVDNPDNGTVYANMLDGDEWPIIRGVKFNDTWSLKPLSEHKK